MISDVDGQVKTRTLEVSLDELQKFKEEIVRIEESLSWNILLFNYIYIILIKKSMFIIFYHDILKGQGYSI